MKRLVKFSACIILLFLLASSISCSTQKSSTVDSTTLEKTTQKKIVLGFSQLGDESDWRAANTESIKSAAKKAGIELKFSNAYQKQDEQIKAIRSFIAQQVDVIAFSPFVESGWDSVLKEAKVANIPVVILDRSIEITDESLYVTYIGSDFEEEGRKAGRWLLEKTKGLKGDINVVEIEGNAGSTPAIGRKKGFEETIKENPNIKILLSQSGDFMESKGKEVMEFFLKMKGNNINYLFAHNDDMALGAVEAIQEYGLKPGNDIKIVSVDANRAAFEAMVAGKINCTVECNPLQGPQLMETVKDIINGKAVPKRILIDEGIFPEESAAVELLNRKY